MSKMDEFMGAEVKRLKEADLDWKIHVLGSASLPHSVVDGKQVLMLCSNNYLGLSNHPKLKKAAIDAVEKYGAGSGSVRAIAGTMKLHIDCEKTLANFKGTEAALLFQTGFMANSGMIPQIAGEGDLIISDELNHGSIIDGVRLTKAERGIYKHKNMEDLRRVLEEAKKKNYGKIWIITDGVFSMDGDIAPMPGIVKLAQEYGAMTYVDDAHGDGVLGRNGRGIVDHFGLHGKVDIEMGTFSKAFGVVGGFICGSATMREYALNKARTFLLTGSHPPAVVAACKAAIEVLDEDPSIVKKLWENTKYFKGKLKTMGFNTGESETPITPIIVGESSKAQKLSLMLFNEGVFALPIIFPMVAKDKARIRTQVSAALTKGDLDFALEKTEKCGKELKIIN
ncbi:MAG: glycine C-acetyltransferase [Candidatus Micrarchaeota archaeon]|nr:glycine C-acetyltransferase [Candidatus Micrarchaeota archaeon]